MNLDWHRLKAVVLESDDWGLCAWSADAQAYRVLSDTPAFRTPAGRRYGGSTLEGAADLNAMADLLAGVQGRDGMDAVLQANTVMAAPNYAKLEPPLFEIETLPLVDLPDTPSRWRRPGLGEALQRVQDTGVWWPELHGLHHLPESAWLHALRRGIHDARAAHAQQSPVCTAVEASGEYDSSEPLDLRVQNLRLSVEKFQALFKRPPRSYCPPDYRWDERLDAEALALQLRTFQGMAESARARLPRLKRLVHRFTWPQFTGERLAMPPRIAFEPVGAEGPSDALGVGRTLRGARDAWRRGQPAVISSHRVNYVHLQAGRAEAGRAALRELLERLAADGAVFLVDYEVRALLERGWSLRPLGPGAAVLRYYGVPRAPVRFPAPPGARGVKSVHGAGADTAEIAFDGDQVVAQMQVGEYRVEWGSA